MNGTNYMLPAGGLFGSSIAVHKHFAWNFRNTTRFFDRTIEWREPPGAAGPDESLAWAELALSFVQAARHCQLDFIEMQLCYPATVEGLRDFVHSGLVPGVSDERYLMPIFEGKSGSLEPQEATHMFDYRQPASSHPDTGRISTRLLNMLRTNLGLPTAPIFFDGAGDESEPVEGEAVSDAETIRAEPPTRSDTSTPTRRSVAEAGIVEEIVAEIVESAAAAVGADVSGDPEVSDACLADNEESASEPGQSASESEGEVYWSASES